MNVRRCKVVARKDERTKEAFPMPRHAAGTICNKIQTTRQTSPLLRTCAACLWPCITGRRPTQCPPAVPFCSHPLVREGDAGTRVSRALRHGHERGGAVGVQTLDGAGYARLFQGHGYSRRRRGFKGEFFCFCHAFVIALKAVAVSFSPCHARTRKFTRFIVTVRALPAC